MKLLLVEDEKRMAQALCEILRLEKYDVDWCADGLSGMDAAESGVYGNRPSTGNEGITDNQQQDIPIIPDIETGRGEMPQIPSGDFKDGDTPKMPDRQEAGNSESIPPDSIDFGNIQKDNRSNGEWPVIPDGEGVADAQPDSDREISQAKHKFQTRAVSKTE